METYHSDAIGYFISDLQETSQRTTNGTSLIYTTETIWWLSFEACLRRHRDELMARRCYVLLKRRHDVPIRRRGGIPLRRLGDIPSRLRWVHLYIWDVLAASLGRTGRRRYDVATTSSCRVDIFSIRKSFSKTKKKWLKNKEKNK